jgi:hypothetical protein
VDCGAEPDRKKTDCADVDGAPQAKSADERGHMARWHVLDTVGRGEAAAEQDVHVRSLLRELQNRGPRLGRKSGTVTDR